MIAIVDGGSTKCAWKVLNASLEEVFETQTIGFNAYLTSEQFLVEKLSENTALNQAKDQIKHLFFYNTGCGTSEAQEMFKGYLATFFTHAEITVRGDLLGSVYALYEGKSFIAGILGTGSNSCFFDGEKTHKTIPSLGYILGDEGGGVSLGKRVLKAYFYQQMPLALKESFENQFDVDLHQVLTKVYSEPNANAYIGGFARFLTENRTQAFCKEIVQAEMESFFETQILPYQRTFKNSEVGLVGSITHYFETEIRAVAEKLDLKISKLIKNPLEDLVEYHKKFKV